MENKREIYEYIGKVASEKDSLSHFRTKGSKNGERLYQYKDGSWTPLGRLRYGKGSPDDPSYKSAARENYQKSYQEAYDAGIVPNNSGEFKLNSKASKKEQKEARERLQEAKSYLTKAGLNTNHDDFRIVDPTRRDNADTKTKNPDPAADAGKKAAEAANEAARRRKEAEREKTWEHIKDAPDADPNEVPINMRNTRDGMKDQFGRSVNNERAVAGEESPGVAKPLKRDSEEYKRAKAGFTSERSSLEKRKDELNKKAQEEAAANAKSTKADKKQAKEEKKQADVATKQKAADDAQKQKADEEAARKKAEKEKFDEQVRVMKGTNQVIDSSAKLAKNLKDISDESIKNAPKVRLDLNDMTDAQLRQAINREQLERQYNDYFAPSTVTKGQKTVNQMLSALTAGLAVTGSALSVAIAIKQLMNK